ncbi:pyruvate kinase [Volvox carteri f. nagariensis]|uniref:Pyruvate kinase n=1 Tax=Volvox carteri f. nagariensis TaxID=3068 RepID=D8UIN9_VOLCA|nr:pyruvate kinase [Volvox carteri f. nagariensis]EFJ40446.1 pyruvate kinase [Volvox carteri f. nagariensis]|eukprot:XP_002958526.1 pyruvate kinase [Volvox carteri f. nagariensis]
MGGRGSKPLQNDENQYPEDGMPWLVDQKNGARPSNFHQLSEVKGVPHTESVSSRLNRGMKVSSVVSFGQLSEDIQRPLNSARAALNSVHSRMDLLQEFHLREMAAAALKREKALDWLPEYRPVSVVPPARGAITHLERVTRVSQAAILTDVPVGRKTKIVCTLGPSCWSESGLCGLLDAGMDVARFNFSHGTHAAHQEVLDRLRKVAEAKKSCVGFLLDTKGPEIRTAMLRGGKDIELVAGQDVTVVAVGEEYVRWEGYKEATGETKIGISYAKLCQSIKPGGTILLADGAISIEVVSILNDTELLGRVINSHRLGQRKNCNLPGVHVDLPVLSPKDIDDVQNFAVKNKMDFVAASFVQAVKIIAKIENEAGLRNIDEILEATDGVMVARGDLAMEVPAEKIALAQKMIIAKANVLGKVVITATQMLESMTASPLPTRAEMTDVANAVFDGTDAVMLSGETANGRYPLEAVRTMSHIVEYVELGVDYGFHHDWVKRYNSGLAPVSPLEATLAGVAKSAITFSMDSNGDGVMDASEGCIAVVFTRSGLASRIISKYRPPCPVITLSDHDWVLRQASLTFGLYPLRVEVAGLADVPRAIKEAIEYGRKRHVVYDGKQILVATGSGEAWADNVAQVSVDQIGWGANKLARAVSSNMANTAPIEYKSPFVGNAIACVQTLQITPQLIIDRISMFRSTKIIATLGPSSFAAAKLDAMLDLGVSLVRFFFHEEPLPFYQGLLERIREQLKRRADPSLGHPVYTTMPGLMATIKGPEVRTTQLRSHAPLELSAGQQVTLVPTHDWSYKGYSTPEGDHVVGIHFPALTRKLRVGDVVVLSEGAVTIKVTEVLQPPRGALPPSSSGGGGAFSSSGGDLTSVAISSSGVDLVDLQDSAGQEQQRDPDYPYGKVVATVLIGGTLGEDRVVDVAGGSLLHHKKARTKKFEIMKKIVRLDTLQEEFLDERDREALIFCCNGTLDCAFNGPAATPRICFRNGVDFVSVPHVRNRDDVLAVRAVLDKHGGARIKIVSHVNNVEAIRNYDELLEYSDAVLVSRANLGMRIPAAKVALAQKWMIAKANLKGRPIIVSAQMMWSMVNNPRPTRAEITDVANALYDGADAIFLREETAIGSFVERTVAIAADILKDAGVGVDAYAQLNYLRNYTPKPMSTLEWIAQVQHLTIGIQRNLPVQRRLSSIPVKAAIDMQAALVAVVTDTSAAVRAVAKYRPPQVYDRMQPEAAGACVCSVCVRAILVVTTRPHVAKQCNLNYGCVPLLLKGVKMGKDEEYVIQKIIHFARAQRLAAFKDGDCEGDQLIVVQGPSNRMFATEEDLAEMQFVTHVIGQEAAAVLTPCGYNGADTISYRSTKVGLDLICGPTDIRTRKTKVVCTLGPSCWSREGLEMLVNNGLNVARFNFSHGTHTAHQEVLDRLREVLEVSGASHRVALLLDTKGPEIRTAMLRGGKDIQLEAGQMVTVVAVGEEYVRWEGYKDEATGETKIGVSYAQLCRDVKPGGMIKIGDGLITLEVLEILSDKELRARALNSKSLGQRKNVNLPGVHVDLPVLGPKDIDDVKNFAAKNKMDFVAASFVQSAEDVRFIRRVLDEVGGQGVRIISKIESTAGLINYDDILRESDGIMVARGDLAMEIPSEKVALAQKMMITKANIAGKFIITATQMLESMTASPLPTRAEMTDVANAVFDGTDAVMLSGETANGTFPLLALTTMANIVANAEVGTNYPQVYDFIRDFSARPMSTAEAVLGCAAKNVLDVDAALILVISSTGASARLVAKYRPRVPVLLVTDSLAAARACAPVFGVYVSIVEQLPASRFDVLLEEATMFAMEAGLCPPGKEVVVVHGCSKADAEDGLPMVAIQVAPGAEFEQQEDDDDDGIDSSASPSPHQTRTPLAAAPQQGQRQPSGPLRQGLLDSPSPSPAAATAAADGAPYTGAGALDRPSLVGLDLDSPGTSANRRGGGGLLMTRRSSRPIRSGRPSLLLSSQASQPLATDSISSTSPTAAGAGATGVAARSSSPRTPDGNTSAAAPLVYNLSRLSSSGFCSFPSPRRKVVAAGGGGGGGAASSSVLAAKTLSLRTTAISLSDILDHGLPAGRKTKIVCTLGPSCWSESGLCGLLDAGMDVARFNFSHGTHAAHQEVLDRLRKVWQDRGNRRRLACLLDTKGPEIRTAMLRDGKDIQLEAGQMVTVVAVGEDYVRWEGYKDEATGETKIGISYAKLCQSVAPGSRILVADGSLAIEVVGFLSDRELLGRCLNSKSLGQRKNVNLPGVHVDIPVLTSKDVEDLQKFCVGNRMDFVAASFVQSADDVRLIRRVLDDAGGWFVKIISKIENESGLINYDDILRESDGIMVARGDLAMEIPSEKVALAQKMMITKANIAGKFIITATQMLESMTASPLPTRAEMTDVANAVFDGTDAVMLSGETANGKFPDTAVRTMAAIVANAENGSAYVSTQAFLRDHTPKPFGITEASGVAGVAAAKDCNAQLHITFTSGGYANRMVSKYRPAVPQHSPVRCASSVDCLRLLLFTTAGNPVDRLVSFRSVFSFVLGSKQIVVTDNETVANQASVVFGQYALLVETLKVGEGSSLAEAADELVVRAATFAQEQGLWNGIGTAILLHGHDTLSADKQPVLRAVDLLYTLGSGGVCGLATLSTRGSSIKSPVTLYRSFSLAV